MMRLGGVAALFFVLPTLLAETLETVSVHQQTAVAELVQSLKSTREVLLRSGGGSGSPPPNPFRSRQEFKLPPMPEEKNPGRRLEKLTARQEELIRKMESSSDVQDLAGAQNQLRQEASSLGKHSSMNLKSAENAMKDSEGMLHSNKKVHALLAARKALVELRQADAAYREKADRRMRETLSRMQETFSEARRKSASELSASLRSMARDLLAEAMEQHRSGKQTHATALARLAEKAEHGAEARKALPAAEELAGELETLRMMDRAPEEMLRSALSRLTELGGQMRYSARHPETLSAEEHRALRRELRLELEDARLALSGILRINGRDAEAERSVEHARKALNLLAGYPDEPHGGVAGRNASSAIAAETMALIAGSERVLGRIQISGTVSVFNPEDVPLRYRKEVGEYFKRLSEKQQRKEREEKP